MTILDSCSPQHAFKSKAEVLRQHNLVKEQLEREKLAEEINGKPHVMLTKKQIKEIQTAVDVSKGAVQADTEQVIAMPLRMSWFVLSNLPIMAGMLFGPSTLANTLFWQVTNQSYNAAMNFTYANKSSPSSTGDLMTSYFSAVGACCTTALALRFATAPILARSSGSKLILL